MLWLMGVDVVLNVEVLGFSFSLLGHDSVGEKYKYRERKHVYITRLYKFTNLNFLSAFIVNHFFSLL